MPPLPYVNPLPHPSAHHEADAPDLASRGAQAARNLHIVLAHRVGNQLGPVNTLGHLRQAMAAMEAWQAA